MTAAMQVCTMCRCCALQVEVCGRCRGHGLVPHDCDEDTCCCLGDDDEFCDECGGAGKVERCAGRCNESAPGGHGS